LESIFGGRENMKIGNNFSKVGAFVITMLMISSVFGGVALAGDVADQQQTQHDGVFFVWNYEGGAKCFWAQSFKPSASPLTKVDLRVQGGTLEQEDLVMHIRHGSLEGDDIAVVHKTPEEIPYPGAWVTFDFPDITVTIDDTYFIVLDKAPDTGDEGYVWFGTFFDLYSRGIAWFSSGLSWSEHPDEDLCFITYTSGGNDPPYVPSNPGPSNGATGVDINADLSWTGGDPDPGDTVYYDVYFEPWDSTPDVKVSNDQTSTSYDPGTMSHSTTYYWQIVAWDGEDTTEGPIWHFTTENPPPQRTITFYTDPTDGGTITFDGSTYSNGQSTTKYDGDYSVSANPAFYFVFDHWSTTGGVSVANQYSQSTTATVNGDGSIKAWFIELSHLGLDPDGLDFGDMLESQTADQTFEIWNDGGGVLYYDFSWGDWIADVYPSSGSSSGEHDVITVSIDTTDLSLGEHTCYISIDYDGIYPYDYPVSVNIKSSIPPPDETLTDANIDHEYTSCTVLLLPTVPFPIDWWLERWSAIPDDMSSAEYGHYGHETDLYTDYARSAIKAEYDLGLFEQLEIPVPVPIFFEVTKLIGVTYDVPITTGPGTEHNARISFKGDYEGEVWIEEFGFATVSLDVIVEDGPIPSWPFIPLGGTKQVKEYEVGAFLFQDVWSFSGSLTHDNDYMDVRLKEGKSYIFWVAARSFLTLDGWDFGYGLELTGRGWSDVEYWFDEIKVDYHNPPVPPPPGEHYPETPSIPEGPTELLPGEAGIYSSSTIDLDGDQLYYKWYWGDGETTSWLGPYDSGEVVTMDHTYDFAGVHFARVQAKDNSEYELQSDLSEPLQVNVTGFEGSITVQSPAGGEEWPVGTLQEITWTWDGDVGDEVIIALYKDDGYGNYEFDFYITPDPIPTTTGSYLWEIDIGQEIERYCIVIFNEANASISNPFLIVNHPPVLSNYPGWPDGVDPDWGTSDTEFTFKVHYYDEDGHEPAVKDVIIDDVHYDMMGSGSDSHYTLTLLGSEVGGGIHNYYFYFEDMPGDSDTLPDTGSWQFTVNLPPNKPLQPSGLTSGVTGTEYTYESITTDPEEEDISYWFDWDDGTNSGWTSFVPSGTQGSASKIWTSPGEYEVKVKARDIHGNESEWSDSLLVTIYGENNAPNQPINPYPADGQRKLGRYVTLAWDGGDPDINDTVTYEIYFGLLPNPPLKYTIQCPATQERMEYEVGPLTRETRYYWKIKAIDDHDAATEGPTWWFKTRLILIGEADSNALITSMSQVEEYTFGYR
jgi:hypothetical protein